MSVANLCTSGSLNAMESDEGNDSLNSFIRQAVEKEPILPFSRTGDSPVQWIQLLHSLDQPDLPGWPLLTPVKVQMQKCEKCSREFCSPINYRRHIRVHRRSLNVDKESHKNRDLLAAFWDKLSLKESTEIVSLSDVMLKDIPGSSIVRALASSLRKPGLWTLPPVYVKAGSALLDIIHAKPPRLPISSQELFSILDNASERTFLCAGTADSVQKYVFDVEAAKNSLELKNLVACTGFLFELQLVKAWVADKDAEALRCHKLLVEEEEAAQKRQAELLERKKQKKLRQKEQKYKEHLYEGNGYLNVTVDAVDGPVLAEASAATPSPSDSNSISPNADNFIQSYLDSLQNCSKEEETDIEAQLDFNTERIILDDFQTIGPGVNDHQHVAINNWQVPKSHKAGRNGFVVRKNLQALKPEATQKLRHTKGQALVNGNKVWTRKFKPNNAGESLKAAMPGEISCQTEDTDSEVMIGSISVALKVRDSRKHECHPDESIGTPSMEHAILNKNIMMEELTKGDSVQSGTKGEAISTSPVESGSEEPGVMCGILSTNDRFSSSERCVPSHSIEDDDDCDIRNDTCLLSGETPQQECAPFSSITAKEFLAQRWKEAISADHVRLVLASGPETLGNSDKMATQASILGEISLLGNVENRLGVHSQGVTPKTKPDKGLRIKYRPKERGVV
ncbi:uncharacterized protein [Primulina huaijiensis]|uniref:uncharacterized protein n=1 Tax=Primulina huaijiensis TaxID=1492673 RepID=UPI003CC7146F